ncbi:DUF2336 domain-containing protein [Oricola sp.]|uniref:DUF2336 domain-containing protein n=1 Tax=Oricola sp. TaxID=1979950 RepID=UPI0025D36909|nr:DUF2336 domain-containing protein [Oricola sp.]MCI5073530.1 hypothetical protein [Oricola sp.]
MTQMTRTSEPSAGDAIAVTACREFCAAPRPSKTDATRLSDLVLPLLQAIADKSRREIAALLATNESAPKPLLLALCDFPVAICSPILTRSKRLSDAELMAILSQHGAEHARAIARRSDLATPIVNALRMIANEGVDRALDLRQRLDKALPPEEAEAFDRFRHELHGEIAAHARGFNDISVDDLVIAAQDPNPGVLRTAVADAIAITLVSAKGLCDNPTSRNLIYMLKFLGATAEQGVKLFSALAPKLAEDPAVIARFKTVFDEVTIEQCVHKVWDWRSDDLLALAREALPANDRGVAGGEKPGPMAKVA